MGLERQNRGGLRERLDDQNSGHDRMMRKMPGKKMLVDGDILYRHDALVSALAFGAVSIPMGDVIKALTGGDVPPATDKIIIGLRLAPRAAS
jgi:hypothetical protein